MKNFLWSRMTLSGIIHTKTSKVPKSQDWNALPKKESQNTFRNTPEDDLD